MQAGAGQRLDRDLLWQHPVWRDEAVRARNAQRSLERRQPRRQALEACHPRWRQACEHGRQCQPRQRRLKICRR
jgi:hypothetical protein